MAEPVDDHLDVVGYIVVKLGAVAVCVHDGGEAAGIVIFVSGDGNPERVLDRRDVVWEPGLVVTIFVREIGPSGTVGQLKHLQEVAGFGVVHIFKNRQASRAGIWIADGGDAALAIAVEKYRPSQVRAARIVEDAVVTDFNRVAAALENAGQLRWAVRLYTDVVAGVAERVVCPNNIVPVATLYSVLRAVLGFENPAGDVVVFEGAGGVSVVALLPVGLGERKRVDDVLARAKGLKRRMNIRWGGPMRVSFARGRREGRDKRKRGAAAIGQGEGHIPAAASADVHNPGQASVRVLVIGKRRVIAADGHILALVVELYVHSHETVAPTEAKVRRAQIQGTVGARDRQRDAADGNHEVLLSEAELAELELGVQAEPLDVRRFAPAAVNNQLEIVSAIRNAGEIQPSQAAGTIGP